MDFLETFYTKFVPFFLFTVMVAMGLSLTVKDLLEVVRKPRAILAGLGAQLLFLPIIAIGYGFLFDSPPVIAAGAIILAACPGGITTGRLHTLTRHPALRRACRLSIYSAVRAERGFAKSRQPFFLRGLISRAKIGNANDGVNWTQKREHDRDHD